MTRGPNDDLRCPCVALRRATMWSMLTVARRMGASAFTYPDRRVHVEYTQVSTSLGPHLDRRLTTRSALSRTSETTTSRTVSPTLTCEPLAATTPPGGRAITATSVRPRL